MHEVLVNRLGGLSLPRKSVVRLTDRPDMTLDVYRGRKTTMQQQQQPKHNLMYLCGEFMAPTRANTDAYNRGTSTRTTSKGLRHAPPPPPPPPPPHAHTDTHPRLGDVINISLSSGEGIEYCKEVVFPNSYK